MDAQLPARYDVDRIAGPHDDAPDVADDPDFEELEPYNPDWDAFGDVAAEFACPLCGNKEADLLILPDWGDGDDVHCGLCGLWYKVT